jgi:NADPH:quinone reductase-like Zn-dependent oxidoreductase
MTAVIQTRYGAPDELVLQDVVVPAPEAGEVLIRVKAAAANAADWRIVRGKPFLVRVMVGGLRRPKDHIVGSDVSGVVEAVGSSVARFSPGDEVFGDLSDCGRGAFAEYVAAPEHALTPKPSNVSFEEAAAVPMAGLTALQALRNKRTIRPGMQVAINGASGGVGTFAVQIAKHFGAEVTAVCSTAKVDLVRSLGADHVVDYTKTDFTKNGARYDLIVAANGYHHIGHYKRALNPGGVYVMVGGAGAQMFQALALGPLASIGTDKTLGSLAAKSNPEDLAFLSKLLEEDAMKPVIDRRYPLTEVATALDYVEAGHARGKVIITVDDAV